jgi:hypothetical protein
LLTKHHEERASLKVDEALLKIVHAPATLEADLNSLDSTEATKIIPIWVQSLIDEGNFKYFRAENKLTREPDYPESKILHWSIIAIIVLVETILNALFLQQGSELGFIGGLISALIITAVNVLVAMIVGTYIVPLIFHIKWPLKILGSFLALIYLYLITNFCFLVGHYRSELNKDPFEAAENAVTSFMENMWGIDNFNGWILVGVSFSVGIFATIKFFIADDKFPGYGNIHRKKIASEGALSAVKIEFEHAYSRHMDEANAAVHTHRNNADSHVARYKLLLNESDQLIKSYKKYISSAEKLHETLVERYRSANKKVRSTEAPGYFDQKPSLDRDAVPYPDTFQLDDDKSRLENIETSNGDTPQITSKAIEAIQVIKTNSAERRKEVMANIYKEAADRYGTGKVN